MSMHDPQTEQFKWIVDILNKNNLRYCIYGGTLLRLKREGDLSKSKGDIDIGIWPEEVDKLLILKKQFKKAGYRVDVCYLGWPTFWSFVKKIDLIPVNTDFPAKIEFAVLRVYNEEWVWAAYTPKKNLSTSRTPLVLIQKVLFKLARKLFRNVPYRFTLWQGLFDFHTIGIPRKFFDNVETSLIDRVAYIGPLNWEEYLEFIYGNWKVPVRDWDYSQRYNELLFSDEISEEMLKKGRITEHR